MERDKKKKIFVCVWVCGKGGGGQGIHFQLCILPWDKEIKSIQVLQGLCKIVCVYVCVSERSMAACVNERMSVHKLDWKL